MQNFTLRLLMALVALAQPLRSGADDATLMVSAVVLPNARCSFLLPALTTADDLMSLAARPAASPSEAGVFRCGGHAASARAAMTLTQLSVKPTDISLTASGFVVTITP
jgi:hypothetical protein